MNVSGIVVKIAPEYLEEVMEGLKSGGLGEVHFHDDNGRIIVTVEDEGSGEEVKKMREITDLPHVLSVELAYSYIEDGIPRRAGQIEIIRHAVPEALKALPTEV